MPTKIINNYEIQREESIKFLGVLLDQHLTWKEHVKLTENKIAKNKGILYKARPYLDKRAFLCLYYSYIHSYLDYANTAWCSTNRTYLKKLQSQQKHAIRIIFHENKFAHTREHFKKYIYILNIYQLTIFNNLLFLHRVKNGKAPNIVLSKFLRPSHHYPTSFPQNNYIVIVVKSLRSKNHCFENMAATKCTCLSEERLTELIKSIFKEEFEIQRKNIVTLIRGNFEITMQEIKKVNNEINELKTSIEHKDEVLQERMEKIEEKYDHINSKVNKYYEYQMDPQYVEEKLIELEDRSRRCNLRIDGVEDGKDETWDQCEGKVLDIFTNQLRIEKTSNSNVLIGRERKEVNTVMKKQENLEPLF